MRQPGPEAEQSPPPKSGAEAREEVTASDPVKPADDLLLEHLERWEERFFRNKDEVSDSLGLDDPALLEAFRRRINAQKQLYEFLGLSDEALNGSANNGEEKLGDGSRAGAIAPEMQSPDAGAGELTGRNEPRNIGRYQVKRALGQGGYGRVYLAHDSDLDRPVAIKVPIAERVSAFMDIEGYLSEARTLARLSHPNIVPVYDVGRTDVGLWYVVSRYMEGGDLAARIKAGRLTFHEAAELVAPLAEALHYAHTQDLFHRDIKPANILLDASGAPSLADFGLALKEENQGKGSGFVGTIAYMSPEQARGEGHLVDGRSDIFSLAIVFYELLVGRRPFWGKSRVEVMQKIIGNEPRPPRQIDDKIPRELERICMKALAKRAAERYSTAKDLAEDLRFALQLRADAARAEFASPSPVMRSVLTTGDGAASSSNDPRQSSSDILGSSIKIVPKGLSSFDEQDADFFLELLPGPRDRNGLPDGLRFWKARIEATDPDKTFRVGIIYGPSGCGKSSLVKAGLLPLLEQKHGVTSVYIEAAGTNTETRLLGGIRKAVTGLDDQIGLVATLASIRRDGGLPSGAKLLLVIDQLEQWLFARQGEHGTELIDALRQCDGEHIQALCLVRDDFWMATTRFMRDLEIEIVSDRNISAVDLFQPKHARNVLAAYGRAYGLITAPDRELSREQAAFLDQAVAGLAQDGTVVPVRLALFAEMVKGKNWTPTTLREVGGTEGVGVKFLEETFSSTRSSPKHRYHQAAAQAVLKSLLPETSADIKGRMRPVDELRAASGYGDRPADFNELIRLLDNDLRLITPVDREAMVDEPRNATPSPDRRNYQLTHDYLVHSLKEWLTRKQRETRRGRAETVLTERAAFWNTQPARRFLPSITEWTHIRLLTNRRFWSEPQKKMIRHTDRLIAIKTAGMVILLAGLYLGALAINDRMTEVRNETHAIGLVDSLVKADIAQVPAIVDEIEPVRRWTDPELVRIWGESEPGTKERLHASLALLPVRNDQVTYLRESLENADPVTTEVIRDALRAHQAELTDVLWADLRGAKPNDRRILPTASLLADFDAADPGWQEVGKKVANAMVRVTLSDVKGWLEALRKARAALAQALAEIYRDPGRPEIEHTIATTILARYVADQPSFVVDLLLDADPASFSTLFGVVQDNGAPAIAALKRALATTRVDPANMPADRTVAPSPAMEANLTVSDNANDKQAARGARAAVALVRLGHGEQVWQLLELRPDPTTRNTLINAFHYYVVPSSALVEELDRLVRAARNDRPPVQDSASKNAYLFDPSVSKKRGLLQALAAYRPDELSANEMGSLPVMLSDLYRNDPDAGVHSAAELLLRRWGREDAPVAGPRGPTAEGAPPNRWYVTGAGQTMVRIDGPVEFNMGSPPDDLERDGGDISHRRRIPRAFAISTKEVTIREFEAFTKETGWPAPSYRRSLSPDQNGPQIKLTWFDAAAYCNRLSANEGLAPCYESIDQGKIAGGMRVSAEAVAAGAYRLPTDAEWEYACRAGATTSRYCGRAPALLRHYEWYVGNSDDRAHPCGRLLPNELGMFDMLANVLEWCHDRYIDPQRSFKGIVVDAIPSEIVDDSRRHFRGLTSADAIVHVRVGTRGWAPPSEPRNDRGFRLARTLSAPRQ